MDVTVLPAPIKSQSDKKEYRQLKLQNGLQILLISDIHGDYSTVDGDEVVECSSDSEDVSSGM